MGGRRRIPLGKMRAASDVGAYGKFSHDLIGSIQLVDMAIWALTSGIDAVHLAVFSRGDSFDTAVIDRLHEATRTLVSAHADIREVVEALQLDVSGRPVEARNALLRGMIARAAAEKKSGDGP